MLGWGWRLEAGGSRRGDDKAAQEASGEIAIFTMYFNGNKIILNVFFKVRAFRRKKLHV